MKKRITLSVLLLAVLALLAAVYALTQLCPHWDSRLFVLYRLTNTESSMWPPDGFTGTWRAWQDGKLQMEGYYRDGKPIGTQKYWGASGDKETRLYSNGVWVAGQIWYPQNETGKWQLRRDLRLSSQSLYPHSADVFYLSGEKSFEGRTIGEFYYIKQWDEQGTLTNEMKKPLQGPE